MTYAKVEFFDSLFAIKGAGKSYNNENISEINMSKTLEQIINFKKKKNKNK